MSVFDFIGAGIGSWLSQGMVVTKDSKDSPTIKKPRKTSPFVSSNSSASSTRTTMSIILLVSGISASAITAAVELPSHNVVCSHIPEAGYLTKNALWGTLRQIASLGDDWQGQEGQAPLRKSVAAAEQLVPSLPGTITNASAGVDGDGNVFFKLQKDDKLAYLTVEPAMMHLLVMVPGEKNLYLDDVKFRPGQFPSKILRALTDKMVG